MARNSRRRSEVFASPRPLTISSAIRDDHAPADNLLDELVERGLFSAERLEELVEPGRSFAGAVVDAYLMKDRELAKIESARSGIRQVDLRRRQRNTTLERLLPEEVMRSRVVFPIEREGALLTVATAESSDELAEDLRGLTNCYVNFKIASVGDIRFCIDRVHQALTEVKTLVKVFDSTDTGRRVIDDAAAAQAAADEDDDDDAPIIQIVTRIMTQARRERASDIHIEPLTNHTRVRFRIDGALKEAIPGGVPPRIGNGIISRIKIMSGLSIVDRRRPQDGQFSITIDGIEVDVRVSTLATVVGEKCVMRLLDKSRSMIALDRLGMPVDTYRQFSKMVRSPYGLVVCVGPTGSGKTTTLYASLAEIADPSINVMTIEDPVEFTVESISQIQTNDQAGLTFANGLRSILRQDPDVILVGEIRDQETTRVAVQAALTGHLVVTSLHANDAVTAVHRLLDMGIEPFMVASSVLGVVGQRLVRRICEQCAGAYQPTEDELQFYYNSGGDPNKTVFKRGKGCSHCANTGFKERIGIYELLTVSTAIRHKIVERATQEELSELAVSEGMRTMRDEAVDLVTKDVTTTTEAMKTVYSL